ncbi:hypothetical protein MKZ38_004437 [Zalerion maritima]|uniref:Uncharacterized protein n=1 Tax=Zalerion maritima TaxID=339359 RepID=A0AAD5WWW4_9PEZI|nr:hypothetical protein MKZ38_004437 [Zalerion maritima]
MQPFCWECGCPTANRHRRNHLRSKVTVESGVDTRGSAETSTFYQKNPPAPPPPSSPPRTIASTSAVTANLASVVGPHDGIGMEAVRMRKVRSRIGVWEYPALSSPTTTILDVIRMDGAD